MKRRNFFIGFTNAIAIPFIPLFRQTKTQTGRILVRPSIEGKILPPIDLKKHCPGGTLCPSNAQRIAAGISKMLLGKTLAVARTGCYLDLETDARLVANWHDHSKDPVRVSIKEDSTTLYFSCGGYFYHFDSHAKSPHERNDFRDAYFYLNMDKLTVQQRTPSGNLCVYIFRPQYEGPPCNQ